jgi:hypothetical protein
MGFEHEIPPKPANISDELYRRCISITAKRARTVINHILKYGCITTEELSDTYGYDHPPRAIRDVRENGIPLETYSVTSNKTGRSIGAYRFGDPSQIVNGRIGGRQAFSKGFKEALIERYGSRSNLTGEYIEARYLQIDHRIPYQVGGDSGDTIEDFMLLDASAQRAKSWSCEHCQNFTALHNPEICRACFWAYPENYQHVAMRQERRLDISWTGNEIHDYEELKQAAQAESVNPQALVKLILRKYFESGE